LRSEFPKYNCGSFTEATESGWDGGSICSFYDLRHGGSTKAVVLGRVAKALTYGKSIAVKVH